MSSIAKVFSKFSKTFWVANTMELFERWAYYGFFMLFANYLTMSTDTGALGLSQTEKGIIMGVGTAILYLLPVITGAIADRIGFKKTLFIAYILYFASFIIMPHCRSFLSVFMNYIFLAIGAALFKPIISATVARTTDDETASIGFGIFYMMVNIGAFIGPLVSLAFGDTDFKIVFYISAALIIVNALVLIFYTEPERDNTEGTIVQAIIKITKNIWEALSDKKLLVFLLILAGFWTMYYQLFFTLPVFISQWIDISGLSNALSNSAPWLIKALGGADGTLKPEHITNMDALFIIILQLVVSSAVMRWKPTRTIMAGFIVASIGMGLTLITQNVYFTIFAILIFAIGEMTGSPKITEYIGRIAPKDKTALYMGTSFIPVALGSTFGGVVAGPVYQKMTDKTEILKQEFIHRGIEVPDVTQNELLAKAITDFNMSASELNTFLWDKYNPSSIWMVIVTIGLAAALALYLYDKFLLKEHSNK